MDIFNFQESFTGVNG